MASPKPKPTKMPKKRQDKKKPTLPAAARPHMFKKGVHNGRKKGTPNKFTGKLKESILQAIEESGRDGRGKDGAVGYFVWLSRAEPAVFGGLIGKVLPTQVEVKDKTNRYTPEEAVAQLQERGLPVPPSLTTLAAQVGRSIAVLTEEDYERELDGLSDEAEPEEADDGQGDGEGKEDGDDDETDDRDAED